MDGQMKVVTIICLGLVLVELGRALQTTDLSVDFDCETWSWWRDKKGRDSITISGVVVTVEFPQTLTATSGTPEYFMECKDTCAANADCGAFQVQSTYSFGSYTPSNCVHFTCVTGEDKTGHGWSPLDDNTLYQHFRKNDELICPEHGLSKYPIGGCSYFLFPGSRTLFHYRQVTGVACYEECLNICFADDRCYAASYHYEANTCYLADEGNRTILEGPGEQNIRIDSARDRERWDLAVFDTKLCAEVLTIDDCGFMVEKDTGSAGTGYYTPEDAANSGCTDCDTYVGCWNHCIEYVRCDGFVWDDSATGSAKCGIVDSVSFSQGTTSQTGVDFHTFKCECYETAHEAPKFTVDESAEFKYLEMNLHVVADNEPGAVFKDIYPTIGHYSIQEGIKDCCCTGGSCCMLQVDYRIDGFRGTRTKKYSTCPINFNWKVSTQGSYHFHNFECDTSGTTMPSPDSTDTVTCTVHSQDITCDVETFNGYRGVYGMGVNPYDQKNDAILSVTTEADCKQKCCEDPACSSYDWSATATDPDKCVFYGQHVAYWFTNSTSTQPDLDLYTHSILSNCC